MGQFDPLVVGAVDFIPDKTVHILTRSSDILVDLFDGVLTFDALPMACMDQT